MSGRPAITLSAAQKTEVETLAAVLSTEQIADYFGIGRRTFYAMMARDEEIAARYKKGKSRAIGAIAQGLIAKARGGDTASMIFYLKTQAGWRETAGIAHSIGTAEPLPADAAFARLARRLEVTAARIDPHGSGRGAAPTLAPGSVPVGDGS